MDTAILVIVIVILSLVALPLVFEIFNVLFLSIYCRLKKKSDVKRLSQNANNSIEKGVQSKAKKGFLKSTKEKMDPYFYGWMRYQTIVCGKIPSHRIRNFLYRKVFCMQITKKTVIYGGCEIRSPWNIKADRCVISTYCILDGRNSIVFEEDVVLGSGVHIWTEEHNVDDPYFSVLSQNKQGVLVKEKAWICSDSTILPGVIVEKGCVLASKAILTKSTEEFGVYAGIPARLIKKRNQDLKYKLNGKPTWHYF